MFSRSLHDQLAVALGAAESVAFNWHCSTSLEHCKKIKTAAVSLHELIK
jgi:hypothetical protein